MLCEEVVGEIIQEGDAIIILKTDCIGPEYAVRIIFTTDNENFYEVGVCVRGTPVLRKINVKSNIVMSCL